MDESSQVRWQFRASEFEPWQTAVDPGRRVEPTSQAEYAGSIPVIGSTSSRQVRSTSEASWRPSTRVDGLFCAISVPLRLGHALAMCLNHGRQLLGDPLVGVAGSALVDQRRACHRGPSEP